MLSQQKTVLLRERKIHTARATQPCWSCPGGGGGTPVLARGGEGEHPCPDVVSDTTPPFRSLVDKLKTLPSPSFRCGQ